MVDLKVLMVAVLLIFICVHASPIWSQDDNHVDAHNVEEGSQPAQSLSDNGRQAKEERTQQSEQKSVQEDTELHVSDHLDFGSGKDARRPQETVRTTTSTEGQTDQKTEHLGKGDTADQTFSSVFEDNAYKHKIFGILRTGFVQRWPNLNRPFVGHEDGFEMDQVRLGVTGALSQLTSYRIQMELMRRPSGDEDWIPTDLLLDAFVDLDLTQWMQIRMGLQFMPGPLESRISRRDMAYTNRSILTSGLRRDRSYEIVGLGTDRELGLTIGQQRFELGSFYLTYLLSVSNGDPGQFNLDEELAGYGLIEIGFRDVFTVAGGGHTKKRVLGDEITRLTERETQVFVDARIAVQGIVLQGEWIRREMELLDTFVGGSGTGSQFVSDGWMTELLVSEPFGLQAGGIQLGVRYADFLSRNTAETRNPKEWTVALWVPFEHIAENISHSMRFEWSHILDDQTTVENQATALYQLQF